MYRQENIQSPNILSEAKPLDEMIFEDHLLWSSLSLIGIDVQKDGESRHTIAWTARVLVLVATCHLFGVTVAYFLSDRNRHPVAFMIYLAFFLNLWFSALFRMKRVRSLLLQIYGIRRLLKVSSGRSTFCFRLLLLLICVSFPAYALVSTYTAALLDDPRKTYWSYSAVVRSRTAKYALYLLGYFSYCGLLSFVPLLITLVLCSLEYRCAEVLDAIRHRLRHLSDAAEMRRLAEVYLQTLVVLRGLGSALSPLLLGHLLFGGTGLFVCLSRTILFPDMDDTGRIMTFQTLVECASGAAAVVSQVLCGSRIAERSERIGSDARLLEGTLKTPSNGDSGAFFWLEKMGRAEPVCLTAGGFVSIRKGLILSVFGVLFTYGLLIINIKL